MKSKLSLNKICKVLIIWMMIKMKNLPQNYQEKQKLPWSINQNLTKLRRIEVTPYLPCLNFKAITRWMIIPWFNPNSQRTSKSSLFRIHNWFPAHPIKMQMRHLRHNCKFHRLKSRSVRKFLILRFHFKIKIIQKYILERVVSLAIIAIAIRRSCSRVRITF